MNKELITLLIKIGFIKNNNSDVELYVKDKDVIFIRKDGIHIGYINEYGNVLTDPNPIDSLKTIARLNIQFKEIIRKQKINKLLNG